MMLFANKNENINKDKIRVFIAVECIFLLVLFAVGGVMLLETTGESLLGKIFCYLQLGFRFCKLLSDVF